MIQDIAPHSYDNHYTPREPREGDFALIFRNGNVLVRTDGSLPSAADYTDREPHYLFSIDTAAYFLCADDGAESAEGLEFRSAWGYSRINADVTAYAIVTGSHINGWHERHRFCGRCAGKMRPDMKEQALRCETCGSVIYPDIHPAVNIGITDGDRLLMVRHTRNPQFPFALVAGFVEFGESAEMTVHREAMEEVGLKVKNLRPCGSQPWGISGNLQIGYFCEVDGDPEPHPDHEEIYEARWFTREDIPDQIGLQSITGTMIHAFKYGHEKDLMR